MKTFTATICGDAVTDFFGDAYEFETIEQAVKELRAYYLRAGYGLDSIDIYAGDAWVASLLNN